MQVELYQDPGGAVLALAWYGTLPERVQDKWSLRLEELEEAGHRLGPPSVEMGPDDLRALVVRDRGLLHRLFFFLHGRDRAVLSHGCTEERDLRPDEWDWLARRRKAYRAAPHERVYRRPAALDGAAPSERDARVVLDTLYPRTTPAQVDARFATREEARLGSAFAARRQALGLPRSAVAGRLGVASSVVRGLEEGDAEACSLALLRRAALALDARLLTRLDETPGLFRRGPRGAVRRGWAPLRPLAPLP